MAISGRTIYWTKSNSVALINKKISDEGPFTTLRQAKMLNKGEFIFVSFISPIIIVLPLIIVSLDMALYLFLLAPLGFEDWNSNYGFYKKAKKHGLPWWSGIFIQECKGRYAVRRVEVKPKSVKVKNVAKGFELIKSHFSDDKITESDGLIITGDSYIVTVKQDKTLEDPRTLIITTEAFSEYYGEKIQKSVIDILKP